jgi:pimeloyl-ACP methyl ester carboxylesterase
MKSRRDVTFRTSILLSLLAITACQSEKPESPVSAQPAPVTEACGWANARCGHVVRPLDPGGRVQGDISIGFALFPRHDQTHPAAGVIVATMGGPGFPAAGSRDAYLTLFAPLLGDRDLLLIENRGPADCPGLQAIPSPTPEAVGACGRSLGPAADFYGSPLAADDMAAVLDALGIAKIDLYGAGDGAFIAQVFAQRHPERLRSVALDGAFATRGESGFFPNTPAAIRSNINRVCERSPGCRDLGGTALARLDRLLTRLRAGPIAGTAPGGDGRLVAVTMSPSAIGAILYDAAYNPVNLRELDAAARAALDRSDWLPLLRLAAETGALADSRDAAGRCMDYPQIYDMTAPPAERRAQRDASLAQQNRDNPGIYAPLTIAEWRGLPLDEGKLDLCLDWPVAAAPYQPGRPVPQAGVFSTAPTLVLSGEFDSVTPPEDAALITTALPNARRLILANSLHIDALDDQADCAAPIVRRFVATLDPGDVSCADRIAPIGVAPVFVRRAEQASPARAIDGNQGGARYLALATAAVATAADVVDRKWRIAGGLGAGLRGGRFAIEQSGVKTRFTLQAVRWAEDLAVSGRIDWNHHTGDIHGVLAISEPKAGNGDLIVRWNTKIAGSRASIDGRIGGRSIRAWAPAP